MNATDRAIVTWRGKRWEVVGLRTVSHGEVYFSPHDLKPRMWLSDFDSNDEFLVLRPLEQEEGKASEKVSEKVTIRVDGQDYEMKYRKPKAGEKFFTQAGESEGSTDLAVAVHDLARKYFTLTPAERVPAPEQQAEPQCYDPAHDCEDHCSMCKARKEPPAQPQPARIPKGFQRATEFAQIDLDRAASLIPNRTDCDMLEIINALDAFHGAMRSQLKAMQALARADQEGGA